MVARELIAAVLGVGVGLVMIAYPQAVARTYSTRGGPVDRRGEYGQNGSLPAKWLWLVRAVGVLVALIGLWFGSTALA